MARADSLLPRLYARPQGYATRLRLELGPLDVAGTAHLMSSVLSWEPVSEPFARLVHRQTEGLPLAVEESVRLMSDRTDLVRHDGEWVRTKLGDIHVPPTVRDAVLERVRRLGPKAQALLQAAAVLMDTAPAATLAAVAELTPGQARTGLAEALARGLLEESASGLIGFRHVLAARAVYDFIPPPNRPLLHQRAGAALETRTRPPVARLARHYKTAGDRERWVSHTERAVDIAAAADGLAGIDPGRGLDTALDVETIHAIAPQRALVAGRRNQRWRPSMGSDPHRCRPATRRRRLKTTDRRRSTKPKKPSTQSRTDTAWPTSPKAKTGPVSLCGLQCAAAVPATTT